LKFLASAWGFDASVFLDSNCAMLLGRATWGCFLDGNCKTALLRVPCIGLHWIALGWQGNEWIALDWIGFNSIQWLVGWFVDI
jgi:predicted small integral membrane protein